MSEPTTPFPAPRKNLLRGAVLFYLIWVGILISLVVFSSTEPPSIPVQGTVQQAFRG